MASSKSWPPVARTILLDAAREYYRQMKDAWPVPDVIMEHVIDYANRELDRRRTEIEEEASARWIDRWEKGQLDAELKSAIEATYQRLSRAERGIRKAAPTKKSGKQLDAEIEQALGGGKR
jgi:hypothetical protein